MEQKRPRLCPRSRDAARVGGRVRARRVGWESEIIVVLVVGEWALGKRSARKKA